MCIHDDIPASHHCQPEKCQTNHVVNCFLNTHHQLPQEYRTKNSRWWFQPWNMRLSLGIIIPFFGWTWRIFSTWDHQPIRYHHHIPNVGHIYPLSFRKSPSEIRALLHFVSAKKNPSNSNNGYLLRSQLFFRVKSREITIFLLVISLMSSMFVGEIAPLKSWAASVSGPDRQGDADLNFLTSNSRTTNIGQRTVICLIDFKYLSRKWTAETAENHRKSWCCYSNSIFIAYQKITPYF